MVNEDSAAMIGIVFVVIIAALIFLANASVTGNLAQNAYVGYGVSKVYGGNSDKYYYDKYRISRSPEQIEQDKIQDARWYMYNNQDNWDCSFGPEAQESPYPCTFDHKTEKWCCIITDRYAQYGV